MRCQACGTLPARRYVAFYQNIGLLILRFSTSYKGHLCGGCIHRHFWACTAVNLFLGWWGVISFCLTPFFLLSNFLYYVGLLGQVSPEEPDVDARPRPASPKKRGGSDEDECYLCGTPLEPEERESRVCRACRV